ncbi:glycosyltransferase family 1 protein [Bifidobacterium sp. ESL0775]|uniref:glycosyltransferase family 1 protein n=1 Tax=Bifidobacterium sp. ESL0775 TaxID=2983230 RepID=UPI0023F8A39D|nr:glycosyltransferase family 1 protein [Bifidobacterium sp. ESL0775]WEV69115.1 glycosyltransferase family 1 protein [Bifidobacterium sp. ESL0775]
MSAKSPIRVMQVMGHMVGGGVEATIMNHYRFIDRSRVQFDFVIDSDSTLVPREEIESLGGRVFVVPPYKHLPQYMQACERLFRQEKPDIVHSNINALSVFPLAAAKKAGIEVRIAHSHSTANPKEHVKTIAKDILRPFSKVFPTDLAACSDDSAKWLFGEKAFREGRIHIIKNAIDLDKYKFDPLVRADMRRSLGVADDQLVIGQVGRFCFQKNQLFTIDVFARFIRMHPDALLVLVGDGELRGQIQQKIEALCLDDKVRILGHRDDVDMLYQAFDILMFPSNYEGLPLTAIEAQIADLPVVMSTKVSKEATIISRLVDRVNLSCSSKQWANECQKICDKSSEHIRGDIVLSEFFKFGYDLRQSALDLERWYWDLFQKRNTDLVLRNSR